jgi:hypothetical protein
MEMLPILLQATPAGHLFKRNPEFLVDQTGQFVGQVVRVKFAVEAVQTAGSG